VKVKVRIHNGQLQVWDDTPAEAFGQLWMSVCPWCHQGPLNDGDVVCGECDAVSGETPVRELSFPPEWKMPMPTLEENP
jgi:hypothetical protein